MRTKKSLLPKSTRGKQILVYVDKWVEMHNEINKLRDIIKNLKELMNSTEK